MTIEYDSKLERTVRHYVKDITCNKCGLTCKDKCNMNFECAELNAEWGYGSDKDGQAHKAHLCEKCFDKLIKTFKIPPGESFILREPNAETVVTECTEEENHQFWIDQTSCTSIPQK